MSNRLNQFLQDDDGAVTVDWVVLTAAIVGMGVVVVTTVANGALDQSSGLNSYLLDAEVTTTY
jgi:Flp pilus assembly pilin Flp